MTRENYPREVFASREPPQLGELWLALVPRVVCQFRFSPARSLHAALIRRLELVDPELSQTLHDAPKGAHASDHPWTISPLIGPLNQDGGFLVAEPGRLYRVRVTALAPRILKALADVFDQDSPMGREPLFLESVPFEVVGESARWERLATYPSLLTMARPVRRMALRFRSPTGFRTRQEGNGLVPPPRLCMEGYLRKWNAFSKVDMPAELLDFAEEHIKVVGAELRPALMQLGRFSRKGVIGKVLWEASGE